ncbi:hypothetical protein CAPTEDRAFT_91199, partial [Capitella teleta]
MLHFAAVKGDVSTVYDILRMKLIHPNQKDKNGNTPLISLMIASAKGNVQCVKKLLGYKADPNQRYNDGRTALMLAVCSIEDESTLENVVDILIKHEADVNLTDNGGRSALLLALDIGNVQCVKKLLGYKADPNQRENDGLTALMFAVRFIKDESTLENVVDILIKHKTDVNLTDNRGRSALQFASARRNVRILTKLLDNRADIVYRDDEG